MKQTSAIKILIPLILVSLLLAACIPATPPPRPSPVTPPATATPSAPEDITLVMGSWRTEDIEQMNRILAKFHEKYPHITIQYDVTSATEYDAVLQTQLESGTGPDIFYLRSYAVSRNLYQKGLLAPLTDLPGLKENFTPQMQAPWATDDGTPYGLPFIATSHAIYYNVDIFHQLGIAVPTTWEELLSAAQKIKDNGYIPFANATGDTWTMAELVFMNLAPNYVGGYEGRMEYLNGKRCFNDKNMIAAFQAIKDLTPFLPDNQAAVKYSDSQQLFIQGKAAMFLSGSWDIPFFETYKRDFEWSVFAPPPPAGQPGYITFHLDAGMGLNAASKYQKEARLFLEWMTTQEFASLLGNELPGFFPMHTQMPELTNQHAQTFLSLNNGRGTDVRFAWDKLREGTPDAYHLIMDGAVNVVNGKQTPLEAANALQNGLAQWYKPAQTCPK